ncbi:MULTISPECIES: hypothetical protein [unclassified Mesorhizobium]|uniref:hypothetical protein n=1 Tax=unclassified Mesorhizobium TaxID=325217 RepID=UPI00047FEA13|nr:MULTISPECIES: hypothetical protein [unclassified Mesorhizobium]RWN52320.1 MAG: hypothetical protein EOR98_22945 [Mesorhizobium sp.]RWN75782.1 MAG: hypothetical protein EOS01_22005 [Mesorhizobium sp.]RWN77149.1 MAG: hypothetical protein EOS02_11475 [Mesorhizobium sp.]RWN87039.1 MAG: hypothetical protein EOS04_17200 [Mesorhizobium sp.]RWO11337.1 MAG: hypothetical protein EOS15_23015 [Mesorhizobium sp.]
MGSLTVGFLGAAVGVLFALFGNAVVLPYVLRQQDQRLAANYRAPVLGWDKQMLASLTRLVYRFLMPVIFGFVGAVAAVQIFGGAE